MSKHWVNLILYVVVGGGFLFWVCKDSFKKYKLYNGSSICIATVLINPIYNLLDEDNRYGYNHEIDFEIQKQHIVYSFTTKDGVLITDSIKYKDYSDPDSDLGDIIVSPFQNTDVGKTFKINYLESDPSNNVPTESINHMSKAQRRTNGFFQGIGLLAVFFVFLTGFIYEVKKHS